MAISADDVVSTATAGAHGLDDAAIAAAQKRLEEATAAADASILALSAAVGDPLAYGQAYAAAMNASGEAIEAQVALRDSKDALAAFDGLREAAKGLATRMRETRTSLSVEDRRAAHAAGMAVAPTRFLEAMVPADRVTLDEPRGIARVLLLREGPGNLGHRHWYLAEALTRAVAEGIFEGVQAYFNHPTPDEDRFQPGIRDVLKLAGYFENCALVEIDDPKLGRVLGIEADFHPRAMNADVIGLLRSAAEYAIKFPGRSLFGWSINALGDGAERLMPDGKKWNAVTHIDEADSVDVVNKAGAGGRTISFREADHMAVAGGGAKPGPELTRKAGITVLRESLRRAGVLAERDGADVGIAILREAGLDFSVDGLIARMKLEEAIKSPDTLPATLKASLQSALESEIGRFLEAAAKVDASKISDGDADDSSGSSLSEADIARLTEDEGALVEAVKKADPKPIVEAFRKVTAEVASERRLREAATNERDELSRERKGLRFTEQATTVFDELKVPADHRPRILREMRTIEPPTNVEGMRARVREAMGVYGLREDGAGAIGGGGGSRATVAAPSGLRTF